MTYKMWEKFDAVKEALHQLEEQMHDEDVDPNYKWWEDPDRWQLKCKFTTIETASPPQDKTDGTK